MRIVQSANDFVDSFLGAQREAAASFGVDKILLEKYITRPRHIEVQVPIMLIKQKVFKQKALVLFVSHVLEPKWSLVYLKFYIQSNISICLNLPD